MVLILESMMIEIRSIQHGRWMVFLLSEHPFNCATVIRTSDLECFMYIKREGTTEHTFKLA